MRLILSLTLPLYALDQLTKYLVLQRIPENRSHSVIQNFFELVNVPNTGAAFGNFKNHNGFFVILSFVALIVASYLLLRPRPRDPWYRMALALLLAGILGNLTDRLAHGHVIDFLLFYLYVPGANPWPAFNVADSCICIAVACFLIHSFREPRARSLPVD